MKENALNAEPTSTSPANSSGGVKVGLWWLVMVEAALLVTLLPTVMAFVLLDGETTSPVIFALLAIPVGPALQSGIFALRRGNPETNEQPWGRYWEGWRTGWKQSLVVWLPAVALAAVALQASVSMSAESVARPLVIVGLILAGILTLCGVTALTVIAAFSFRTRDLVRVALYVMGARARSTIGIIAVLLVAGALVFIGLEAVALALASVLCLALLRVVRPMHQVIRDTLTADPQ